MNGEHSTTITDQSLLERLQAGDETAFSQLVAKYHASMVRIAAIYVKEFAIAEEVAQETWIAILKGLDRFEGRSSFKTWIFTILANRAKTRATRESRYVPLELSDELEEEPSTTVRFTSDNGHWADGSAPHSWDDIPETRLLGQETNGIIFRTIEALSPNQQQVIRLRDVDGFSAEEVCNMLQLSESNQRVLLHRARERVRQALESYFAQE